MSLYVCHFTWRLPTAQSQRSESGVPRTGRAVRAVRRARLSALRVPERQACSWCPGFNCQPLPLGKGHASLTPGVWTKRILLLLLVCKPQPPPACASLLVRPPDLKGRSQSFVRALSEILYSTKCLHHGYTEHLILLILHWLDLIRINRSSVFFFFFFWVSRLLNLFWNH